MDTPLRAKASHRYTGLCSVSALGAPPQVANLIGLCEAALRLYMHGLALPGKLSADGRRTFGITCTNSASPAEAMVPSKLVARPRAPWLATGRLVSAYLETGF